MPSLTQIIPQYDVPHVATYINDNSGISTAESVQAQDPTVRLICPIVSSKGPDGELKEITSTDQYIKTYGQPDIKKYGQAGYIPYVALRTGYARCYCMRVAPKDATIANMIVLATVGTDVKHTLVVTSAGDLADAHIKLDGDDNYYVFGADSVAVAENDVIEINTSSVADGAFTATLSHGATSTVLTGTVSDTTPATGTAFTTVVDARATAKANVTNKGLKAFTFSESTFVGMADPASIVLVCTEDAAADTTGTWALSTDLETAVDLTTYGITVANGSAKAGDKITVTYTAGPIESGVNNVKFETVSYPGIISADNAQAQINDVINYLNAAGGSYTAGTGGAGTYVLFGVTSIGRGTCGNTLSVRIVTDSTYDANGSYKSYMLEVYSNSGVLAREEIFRGTLFYAATLENESFYLPDAINTIGGSDQVKVYVNEDTVETIYNIYAKGAGVNAVPQAEFDILFGKVKGDVKTSLDHYSIAADSIAFDTVGGIMLTSGDDGSFSIDTPNRDLYIEAEYRKALFTGNREEYFAFCNGAEPGSLGADTDYLAAGIDVTEDETVKRRYSTAMSSKRRSPAELILDANFPVKVKLALRDLALYRYDAQLILDMGILESVAQAKNVNSKFAFSGQTYLFDTPIITRFFQACKVRDPFTFKQIDVTYTYCLAESLTRHMIVAGTQQAHVGERYAIVTDMIPGTMKPEIDADDLVTKQYFYENRLNTVDYVTEGLCIQATQVTCQTKYTDLSEFNNVSVLLEMKRSLESLVYSNIYNFAEQSDRNKFTEIANKIFESYTNSKVKSFNVRFDMNAFEEERNILHCYLEVVFRTMATKGIIEIDINSRANIG